MRRDPTLLERARDMRAAPTAAERRMWHILRDRRLAALKFRRQHPLGDYIADFVCLAARLVIEVDGDTHGEETAMYDVTRTHVIERLGFEVIRFFNGYVMTDREGVTQMILEALRTSALPPVEKRRLYEAGLFEHPSP